jgi:hypothetical protein
MRKFIGIIALCGIGVAAHADPFQNGSFENGNFVANGDDTMSLAPSATDITGWTVVGDSIAWIGPTNPFNGIAASDGSYSLDLTGYGDGGPSYGGVQQIFDTIAGATYTVKFDLGQNGSYGPSDIYAEVGPSLNEFSLPNNEGQTWQTETFTFVASGTSTAIQFVGNNNSGGTNYVGLDNVRITTNAVPEPVSMTLLGLGAFSLLRKRSR